MTELESRIIAVLTDDQDSQPAVTSAEIEELLDETQAAIEAAEANAAAARARACDPLAAPDAAEALRNQQLTELAAERLCTLLDKLEVRAGVVARQEAFARWLPTYHAAKERRDALITQLFFDCYLPFANKFAPLAMQVPEVDQECWRVNETAPDGANMYLKSVEEEARGRRGLLHDLCLPGWEPGSTNFWPRRT